ncbi:inverse autotransporter beta domain-containing protein, partial [Enterobacter roggenkampii]
MFKRYFLVMFSISRWFKITAWFTLIFQILLPLMFCFSSASRASDKDGSAQENMLPDLGGTEQNRTEQNRTEQNRTEQNRTEQNRVAAASIKASAALKQDNAGQAAKNWVTDTVTGQATREIQEWLGHYGTAHVRLNTDSHLSLKNSQFDVLLPLWALDDNLVFIQGGMHRSDNRTQSSIGTGLRHFSTKYMVGGNIFLDNDLTQNHARYGIGAEYWRDNLKLSSNMYARLTNWKQSSDVDGYEARPANGWDVRSEGYLPAMPQLGAKLVWEQYYGDEVALFGKDKRQNNPHALTAGMTWTPVPLLTFGIDRRQGGSEHDSRVTLDASYKLGLPFSKQFDSNEVAIRRSLTGSRYDVVDRNNDIVLEYRKKDTLRLTTVSELMGYSGEIKSLNVQVNATHGVDHITWDAPELFSRGGQIVHTGSGDNQYSVILPAWQSDKTKNTYQIKGVAYDRKGNTSSPSLTSVVVISGSVDVNQSSIKIRDNQIETGGSTVVTFTAKDGQGNPITGLDDLTAGLSGPGAPGSTLGPWKDNGDGTYTATLTGGGQPGDVTVMPQVGGKNAVAEGATVTLTAGDVDSAHSEIKATPTTMSVGDNSVLIFTAHDSHGNPITGLTVGQVLSGPAAATASVSTWHDNGDGTYSATLTGTKP